MAPHSSALAWRIPGTEEHGGLPSMGLHRVRHDWSDLAAAADCLAISRLPLRKPLLLLPWTWWNFKEISALPSEFDILFIIWSWATIHPSWVRGPGALVCSQLEQLDTFLGLPCGSVGKESACNAGDLGSTLGLGRSPGEGNGKALQYSCLENLAGYSPWGCKGLHNWATNQKSRINNWL